MPYAVVWPFPVQCPGGEGVVILDLFAGPGGWDLGLEMLAAVVLGVVL